MSESDELLLLHPSSGGNFQLNSHGWRGRLDGFVKFISLE